MQSNAPAMPVPQPPTSQSPNRPAPSRQGAAPGQPLQQGREGAQQRAAPEPAPAQGELRGNQGQRDQRSQREGRPVAPNPPGAAPGTTGAAPGAQRNEGPGDVRGAQPGRDQRNLREGGPAPSPNALGPSDEGRRGPQAGVPGTGGGAPSGRERELRNRPPEGVAPPQEPRGRERSGIESQGPRNQNLGGERGAAQGPAPALRSQRPSAVERGPSPGLEAPRSHAPAAEGPRPLSPTTGAAPQGGRTPPGAGGRREEQR